MRTRGQLITLQEAPGTSCILDAGEVGMIPLGDFQLDAQGEATQWHKLAVEGKWDGHWMGAFILTPTMFDQMVHSFDASDIETVVDYEHSSVYGSDTAPAAGWINQLQTRRSEAGQGELWGQVKWTARASNMIKANEKKYLSPTINFNARDRITGKPSGARLHSVALTNTPFLHELPEVRLNSLLGALGHHQPEANPMDKEQFKALCVALKLDPETTTQEQALIKLAAIMAASDTAATELTAIRAALSVTAGGSVTEAISALNVKAATGAAGNEEMAAMRVQVAVLSEAHQTGAAEAAVIEHQRLGRVGAKGTDSWNACMDLAKKNPETFQTLMGTIAKGSVGPVVETTVPNGADARASSGADAALQTPEFKTYCTQLGITAEDLEKAKAAGTIQ